MILYIKYSFIFLDVKGLVGTIWLARWHCSMGRSSGATLVTPLVEIAVAPQIVPHLAARWLLAQQPAVLAQLQMEVQSVVGDTAVTFDHLAHMPLLEAVTKETLRLYLDGFGEEVETLETAVPLADSPNVVIGVYRFTGDETMVLLLGAAVNPLPDSSQPVVALSGVVPLDELAEMRLIFETILRTLRPAEAA